jgi:hypothetical protein
LPTFNEITGAWEPDDDDIDLVAEGNLLLKHMGPVTKEPTPAPSSSLSHHKLVDREFGSHLLSVANLTAWATKQGLEVSSQPSVERFQFVQVEALLCAIECKVQDETSVAMASEILGANSYLAQDRIAGSNPRWLLGADAHQKWRDLIGQAVMNGELSLLDYGSKLPITTPTKIIARQPVTVERVAQLVIETSEKRQVERYQRCLDAGLKFSKNPLHKLPKGVGKVASHIGITRQSLSSDVKAHIARLQDLSS